MAIKVNSPEQLYDSLVAVVGAPGSQVPRPRPGANQGNNRPGPNARTVFVNFFSNEDGSDPTQYQSTLFVAASEDALLSTLTEWLEFESRR